MVDLSFKRIPHIQKQTAVHINLICERDILCHTCYFMSHTYNCDRKITAVKMISGIYYLDLDDLLHKAKHIVYKLTSYQNLYTLILKFHIEKSVFNHYANRMDKNLNIFFR